MEYTVRTPYNLTTLTALARALRKIFRVKKTRMARILAVFIIYCGASLVLAKDAFDFNSAITVIAVLVIAFVMLNEDTLNGWIALKRGVPGLKNSVTVFRTENYVSATELGETTFFYENVFALAESRDCFFLLFGPSHGQVYAKAGMEGGTVETFRNFLQERTGLTIQEI